jgi:hypothetical protein
LRVLLNVGVISGGGGLYHINPEIFWKGENSVRNEYLKNRGMKVVINFDGKE